jgi:hypothetical protein
MPEHLALDADGELLAATTGDGMLSIHDAADGLCYSALPHRSQGLSFAAPARLRSQTSNGDWNDWTIERPFAVFEPWQETPRAKADGIVSSASLSPDGKHLLTVSAGCAALWSVAKRSQTGLIPLESQRVDDRASGWWLGNDAILIQVPGGLERVPVNATGQPGPHQRITRVPGATIIDVLQTGDWLVTVMNEDGTAERELWPQGSSEKARPPGGNLPTTKPTPAVHGNEVHVTGHDGRPLRLTIPNPAGIADACMTDDGKQVIIVTKDHRVMSWWTETLARTLDTAGF